MNTQRRSSDAFRRVSRLALVAVGILLLLAEVAPGGFPPLGAAEAAGPQLSLPIVGRNWGGSSPPHPVTAEPTDRLS